MPEIVAVGLHRQPIYADHTRLFLPRSEVSPAVIVVITRLVQDPVRDEILPRAVAFHNRLDQILRHILVIGQQLLRILRQAVASITERRVVVMVPDPGIQTYPLNDGLRIQPLHLGIGIQFVEEADTQRQIGIGKELDGLRLGHPHEERINLLFYRPLPQQGGKGMGRLHQPGVVHIRSDNDPARIEVVIQGPAFAQELGRKNDVLRLHLLSNAFGISDRNRTFDHHDRIRIDPLDDFDDGLHAGRIEEVLHRIIIRRCGDHDKVGNPIGTFGIERRPQIQRFGFQVLLNLLIHNRRDAVIYFVDLLRNNIHGNDFMMLAQQRRNAQTDITRTGHCNLHNYLTLNINRNLRESGHPIRNSAVNIPFAAYSVRSTFNQVVNIILLFFRCISRSIN